jgi:uncharacterized membrane protein YhhN
MTVVVFAIAVCVGLQVWAEARQRAVVRAAIKPVASALFVCLGLARWTVDSSVDLWLVAALVLCALGDVLLLSDRTFDAGLFAFLSGHLAFAVAFHHAQPLAEWHRLPVAPLAVIGVGIGAWLWPHLGRRRGPVTAYILAITVMCWGALAVTHAGAIGRTAAPGAMLFLLSDITVARQRFVRPNLVNRALGLPMYYAGQVLLAFTVGTA